jgi:hypothetical protein
VQRKGGRQCDALRTRVINLLTAHSLSLTLSHYPLTHLIVDDCYAASGSWSTARIRDKDTWNRSTSLALRARLHRRRRGHRLLYLRRTINSWRPSMEVRGQSPLSLFYYLRYVCTMLVLWWIIACRVDLSISIRLDRLTSFLLLSLGVQISRCMCVLFWFMVRFCPIWPDALFRVRSIKFGNFLLFRVFSMATADG